MFLPALPAHLVVTTCPGPEQGVPVPPEGQAQNHQRAGCVDSVISLKRFVLWLFQHRTVHRTVPSAPMSPSSGTPGLPTRLGGHKAACPGGRLLQTRMGSGGSACLHGWGTPKYPLILLGLMPEGKWTKYLFSFNSLSFLSELNSSGMCCILSFFCALQGYSQPLDTRRSSPPAHCTRGTELCPPRFVG